MTNGTHRRQVRNEKSVNDEPGSVFAAHGGLADVLAELGHALEHGGVGVLRADHLHQLHHLYRVEEVQTHEVLRPAGGQSHGGDGQ